MDGLNIIILEGCDGAGKTTLANELHKHTGYEIVKGSSFEISEMGTDRMFDYMMKLLDRKNIIIDRFYLSNYVYGNLYAYPTMDVAQFSTLAYETQRKAATIYVTAHESEIQLRISERGDDKVTINRVKPILDMYNKAFTDPLTSQPSILTINTSFVHVNQATSLVAAFADLPERKIFMNQSTLL